MNKYEHAQHSSEIFGGKAEQYQSVHAAIDTNKLVTPSIFGRFFLHHIDIGLPILQKVFGETIGSKKVPLKKLLIQHLVEDYGKVITFKNDWMPALKENEALLPKLRTWASFTQKAQQDVRLKQLDARSLKKLDDFFMLKTIITDRSGIQDSLVIAIFGHALGADLACAIIGPKFHGAWASDVVTGYLNCRFESMGRNKDAVPTLLDYEQHIPDLSWMHAPVRSENWFDPKKMKEFIDSYEDSVVSAIKTKEFIRKITLPKHFHYPRRPCNFD